MKPKISQKALDNKFIAKVYTLWKGKGLDIKEISKRLKTPAGYIRQALLKVDPWLELNI